MAVTHVPALAPSADPGGFEDAVADLLMDYMMNKKRSICTVKGRIRLHLQPVFGGQPLSAITTVAVRAYSVARQTEGGSNATVNRELITLKRMLSLAVQADKIPKRPYIPLLKEQNARRGFFEPAQFERVLAHLPEHARGVASFAYITGWRTPSEILPLEWRQVDMAAGEVRLDPGTTKNGDGRVFPMTRELRQVLERQQTIAETLRRERDVIVRHVFCYAVGDRAGRQVTQNEYWHSWCLARAAADCPDRIPHDFRRTAVRNLVRTGVPERVAMQLTGHKTRAVFERYNITSPNDLREAALKLDTYSGVTA
ncbi:MAG: site-specific integrase [Acidobacteria bacterium]|nr:site-specific integrase [Acidobacteriota bacterium]